MRTLCVAALALGSATLSAQSVPEPWVATSRDTIGVAAAPLTTISAVVTDGAGRIFVGQPIEHDVAVFSPEGQPMTRIGRRGRGPGEFEGVSAMGWLGDTLWVSDQRQARTSLFDRDGSLLTTFRQAVHVDARHGWRALPTAYLEGGNVLSVPGVSQTAFSTRDPAPVPVLLSGRQGDVLDTIALQPVQGRALSLRAPNGAAILSSYQPFSEVPIPAVDPAGRRVILVDRPAAEKADVGYFHVSARDATGRPEWSHVYSYKPTALSGAVRDSILRQLTAEFRETFGSAGLAERAVKAALLLPRFVPPVTSVIVGTDGTIWLRREDVSHSHVVWFVLDDRGQLLAWLTLPRGSTIKTASRSGIWAVEHNVNDEPLLVRYDVRPAR